MIRRARSSARRTRTSRREALTDDTTRKPQPHLASLYSYGTRTIANASPRKRALGYWRRVRLASTRNRLRNALVICGCVPNRAHSAK